MTPWKKECHLCKQVQYFKNFRQLRKSICNNTTCKSCSSRKMESYKHSYLWKIHLEDLNKIWSKNCPKCKTVQLYKSKRILNRAIKKQAVCRRCQLEIRKPTFISGIGPNYNPTACKYFDELNIKNGWNLKHAMNGGEQNILNFFVDAYDSKNNIVVEYDESHHFKNGVLKSKDIRRQHIIIDHINCKFYRYRESTKELVMISD